MSYLCSKCGSELSEDALFCSKCGEKVAALRCPSCGKRLPEDSAFCTYCGAKIAVEQAASSQPEVQQTNHTAGVVPTTAIQQTQNQPIAEQPPATDAQEAPSPDSEPVETAAPLPSEDASADIESVEQQPTSTAAETAAAPACNADNSSDQHHYHLTRRKFRLTNAWGFLSEFEETDFDVSDHTVTISDHLLNKNEPVLTQFQIPDLRQIFIGRTISIPWLCSALFFTILLLVYLVSDKTMGARASGLLLILVVMSWIMAWYRTIAFRFKDGKKIIIRGREKDVMQELRKDLLGRIEAEPDYTGDLSDVVIKNTQYYLPEFEKAKRNEKCRFNWAAFFFNGIFAYYRKSQEIFWNYYKWPLIIYAVIILGISGSGFLAVQSEAGLLGWSIAVGVLSLAVNIYLLIVNIRFGKSFNKEYYQHCMVRAESSEITPRTVGTSAKNAVLYWIIMSLCVGVISVIAGGLMSAALIGGISGGLDDDAIIDDETYQEIQLLLQTSGCWEVTETEIDGAAVPFSNSSQEGICLIFHTDYTAEAYYFENGDVYCADATWEFGEDTIRLDLSGSDEQMVLVMSGDTLVLPDDDGNVIFEKTSDEEQLPEHLQSAAAKSEIAISDFVGEYTYDASFENPDGTYTNFCYSLSVEPSDNGVLITEVWRGIYSFCDDFASKNDLEGDTLYFVVKYGDNAGTHSLTYVPAAQSTYDCDTIYIDGDTDMPYLRDTSASATSYVPSTDYSAPFSAFVGTWQDENNENAYLFVGYGDETEEAAYAYAFVPTGDYQVQLIENGSTNAFGNFMRDGSEPEFSIDLTRESGWIDATVYYGATDTEKSFRFLPVDPATCAYRNPYYIGGEPANDPCTNDYDFGSGNTVYDYALDSSSGYDFNHEPENWGDLINGFNALNENLENNFWGIVGAMN